ncbi:hypothetical protein ES703_20810 [subsurface metagenome]
MRELDDLDREEILGLIQDAVRNMLSHTGLWFRAVEEELSMDEALQLDGSAWDESFPIQSRRVSQRFGWEEEGGIPTFLTSLGKDELITLLEDLAKNWLANDGIWFRAVEEKHGMALAKKFNDEAWKRFTVIEAKRIMKRLQIPENSGIAALEQALKFRLYARVNKQETLHIGENKIVFRMNDCRVQSARRRAGLPEYPCKSAGMIEYPYFARAIDPHIETRCIACPPDPHPEEYWCAWEFELK